jgi:hypothetical protein
MAIERFSSRREALGDVLTKRLSGASRAQLGQRFDNERKAVGQVIARPAVEPHPLSILAGNDPEAIVLDFMQPWLA